MPSRRRPARRQPQPGEAGANYRAGGGQHERDIAAAAPAQTEPLRHRDLAVDHPEVHALPSAGASEAPQDTERSAQQNYGASASGRPESAAYFDVLREVGLRSAVLRVDFALRDEALPDLAGPDFALRDEALREEALPDRVPDDFAAEDFAVDLARVLVALAAPPRVLPLVVPALAELRPPLVLAAPARLVAALPAALAALPAALATRPAADTVARPSLSISSAARFAWPAACLAVLVWRVAAAFLAEADRWAFV